MVLTYTRPVGVGASRPQDVLKRCTTFLSQCRRSQRWKEALDALDVAGSHVVELDTICYNAAISVCAAAGQWQRSLLLLQVMEADGPFPSVVTYGSAVAALRRGGHWQHALQLLERAQDQKVQADSILLCSVISTCEQSAQWQLALHLAESMYLWTLETSTAAYNVVISTAVRNANDHDDSNLWETSVCIFQTMQCSGLEVDLISIGATMSAYECTSNWLQAFSILSAAQGRQLKPGVVAYGAACAAARHSWKDAAQLLLESQQKGVLAEVALCGAVLASCDYDAKWQQAVELLAQQLLQGPFPNVMSYTSTMSACEKAHAWEMALYLLFHLWYGKLQPDIIALNCGLSACATAQRWEEALKLGADAKSMAIQLNTISYNSLITALNVGQDFHHAREVQVFEEMLRENVTVDIITFNSLIGACMRRADWRQALQWLRQIEEVTLEADRVTYGTCLAVLDQAEEWQRSLEVLEKAIRQGIEASGVLITSTMAACDRAGMWQEALLLFDVAVHSDGADIRSFNTALRAIAASGPGGAWRRALHLLSSMTSHHIIADCKSFLAISDAIMKNGQVKQLPWDNTGGREPLSKFYANKGILLTGVTGFVGKVLLEKLLWEFCGNNSPYAGPVIYVLVRSTRKL
eukprot:symbB.v1.2.001383.t1/scaffold67.1/size356791/9